MKHNKLLNCVPAAKPSAGEISTPIERMNIEESIQESVLDQDHLADLLHGNETNAQVIMSRVIELIREGRIELYTHVSSDGRGEVLSIHAAIEIAANPKCWSWRTEFDEEQLYFLSPIR